jgi:hypothetical protein
MYLLQFVLEESQKTINCTWLLFPLPTSLLFYGKEKNNAKALGTCAQDGIPI